MTDTQPQIFKGLAGVVVDVTAVSKVNPDTIFVAVPRVSRAGACREQEF